MGRLTCADERNIEAFRQSLREKAENKFKGAALDEALKRIDVEIEDLYDPANGIRLLKKYYIMRHIRDAMDKYSFPYYFSDTYGALISYLQGFTHINPLSLEAGGINIPYVSGRKPLLPVFNAVPGAIPALIGHLKEKAILTKLLAPDYYG
ncbi:MAG: hypothetical protein K6G03_10950, partial [Lachnospiraceae bacterium]|nr:hypothetical protein [Lachnospiraceae bacterium]